MTFSDYWSDVVWSIEMPSFDYLEDVVTTLSVSSALKA